ncbi:hypothetical protein SISSUDRAFT_1041502 [Sistotremastrum suecicum HHB10207 ss-3]|uniref:Succinate dehydrogenase assembly factor 4, mitochondrial n=1 Tax=Sistotremastrum suecicum HHB10207 ss-3 TaxID=1314776 RepID=A0A166HBC2_9AGAM|nr:hypothetical protein SISSUDRAFT_1041502 [Sistotremastrum suecicum HHB10207 ss-3]
MFRTLARTSASHSLRRLHLRPAPPPLPEEDQRTFEQSIKDAATPAAQPSKASAAPTVSPGDIHPDARRTPPPEFVGDTNPVTGEQGGPKHEPLRHGDWSYSGRITDF